MSDPNEEVINEVLSRAYSREQAHGRPPIYFRTPLDEVLAAESGDSLDEGIIRQEARDRMLEYFFGDGPHPGHVVRRIFAMAKAIKPHLVLNMSLEEMGLMLGETKAAGSWRIKQLINRPLAGTRCAGTHLPWQKSASAVAKYAAAAVGNHNRSQGSKKKKSTKPNKKHK
jgi:hypothetical protein